MATTYIKAPAGFPRRYIIISADEQGITELGFDDTARRRQTVITRISDSVFMS
ncbi:hypothetical protein NWE50_08745 [Morganella morganii]|nr:hypothetical protein [Morganella morganii]